MRRGEIKIVLDSGTEANQLMDSLSLWGTAWIRGPYGDMHVHVVASTCTVENGYKSIWTVEVQFQEVQPIQMAPMDVIRGL